MKYKKWVALLLGLLVLSSVISGCRGPMSKTLVANRFCIGGIIMNSDLFDYYATDIATGEHYKLLIISNPECNGRKFLLKPFNDESTSPLYIVDDDKIVYQGDKESTINECFQSTDP